MALNARKKGASGERECARWLKKILNLDYLPERNLEQVRHGGYDLMVEDFVIEVKRQQVLNFRKWWLQVVTASKGFVDVEPVVIYRQNKQPWRILISARHIGLPHGYMALGSIESKQWLSLRYELMIQHKININVKAVSRADIDDYI